VMPSVDPTLFAALVAVFIPVATSALTPGHLVDKTKPIPSSFERILATTGTTFLRSKVSGDTTDRLKITADGKFVWTPGNSATPAPQLAYDATLAGLLATGKLGATALAPTETPLTVTAAGSQSADIFTVRSSAPAVLVKVDASGQFSAQNFKRGTGAPNTVVNGNVGDVYQQLDGAPGATLWIKETGSGNTGWNASGTTSAGLVLGGGQIPTGGILEWSHSVLPGGYLWCDGSAVSRATFSALNALYSTDGYPYGAGNGSTTFNLPDKRGIITAGSQSFGVNGVVGVADRQIGTTIGGTVGNRNKSLIIAEMPFHDHPGTQDAGHAHASNKRPNTGTVPITPGAGPQEVETVLGASGFGVTGINFASITTGGQGSAQAFSLLQPTVLSRFIVKY
jgi:microcystin-dependent protein